MVRQLFTALLGSGGVSGEAARELIQTFRVNAEGVSQRGAQFDAAALEQFAAEFANPRQGWFDRFVDGLNRLPRPLMVLGMLALLIMPVIRPSLAAEVFTAWAIIPNPVWVLVTLIFSFFFGGRAQVKDINFTRELTAAASALPAVISRIEDLRELTADAPRVAETDPDAEATIEVVQPDPNPALDAMFVERDLL